MPAIDYTERTCIIVVEIGGQAGTILVGIVVDAVSEVLNIKGEDKKLQSGMSVQANIRIRENRTVLSLFADKFFTGLDKFKETR